MTRLYSLIAFLALAIPCEAGIREASVIFTNGDRVGSGQFVARDQDFIYGITCAHGFIGKIGGKFRIEAFDGSTVQATLMDIDHQADIALFSVLAKGAPAVDVIPIATGDPDEGCPVTISGFPGGNNFVSVQGNLDTGRQLFADEQAKIKLYKFNLSGALGPGVSGGSVTQNNKLIGIVSASNDPTTYMLTCDYVSLYKFSSKDRQTCFGGRCRKIKIIQRGNPQSPPVPPPAEDPGKRKIYSQPPKTVDPIPDTPPPKPESAAMNQADIDALIARITALEKATKQPGPAGEPGPRGPTGPAGAGADSKEVADLKNRLATLEKMKIPVVVYDGDGKVKSRKTVPLGQPLEFKFSQLK